MRPATLLPFALVALVTGACTASSNHSEQTAFQVPTRDLTLQQPDGPVVEVASPVELRQTAVHRAATRTTRGARRTVPAPEPVPVRAVETARPAASPATSTPASATSATAIATSAPPDPYALAPGQTITVLPVSSGSSAAPAGPGPDDAGPPDQRGGTSVSGGVGGHGGSCGGRGGRHGGGGWGGGARGLR